MQYRIDSVQFVVILLSICCQFYHIILWNPNTETFEISERKGDDVEKSIFSFSHDVYNPFKDKFLCLSGISCVVRRRMLSIRAGLTGTVVWKRVYLLTKKIESLADSKINITERIKICFGNSRKHCGKWKNADYQVENIVGKGENADY